MADPVPTKSGRVWDLPVRLTHWSFALLVPAMWITAENSQWGWHMRIGHVLLGLIVFRLIWGILGTDTARFGRFVKGPATVSAYLRGRYPSEKNIGHNPLGALAVLALLGVMLAQVGMGLFAGDPYDGATGPLNPLVGVGTADWLTDTHEWFVYVVFGMIGLHIAAIGFYGGIKLQNLIGPMIGGKGEMAENVAENSATPVRNLVISLAAAIGVTVWIWFGAPPLG